MVKRILLTGAGGFAGSHMLRHLLINTDAEIVCPVTFKHRGTSGRIASALRDHDEWHKRTHVVMHDLTAPIDYRTMTEFGAIDEIFNIASESHVDRSISDPVPFVQNNVNLQLNLLEYARVIEPRLFLQMSTDEVYGAVEGSRVSEEWDPIIPSNPYAASKAAQEAIAISYWRTYGVPIIITNTMNLFGEMQDTEKYFAKIMKCIINDDPVPVHTSPTGKPGSRYYIHARNFAAAWLFISEHVPVHMYPQNDAPRRLNIVGDMEISNLDLAKMIADAMGKDLKWEAVDYHSSRPGHDLRYALDGSMLDSYGWRAPRSIEETIKRTVEWTLEHPEWL